MKLKKCYFLNKFALQFFLLFLLISSSLILAQEYNWQNIGFQGKWIYNIAVDDTGNVYASVLGMGIYKSTDNGNSWNLKANFGGVHKIAFDQQKNIYLAGLGGVYKSTDGGNTFFQIAQSIPADEFYDIVYLPEGILFVSSFVGIFKSTDGGISWNPTSFVGFGAGDIGINETGVMFFANCSASWAGLYRSLDLGNYWESIPPYLFTYSIAYLNNGDMLVAGSNFDSLSIYKSSDNGNSWENIFNFAPYYSTSSDFTIDINSDIYISINDYEQKGVYLSSNNGYYWQNIGLDSTFTFICLAIDSSGYLYTGTTHGIFRAPGRTIPVTLNSFSANVNIQNVLLKWSTSTETNNKGFEVEKHRAESVGHSSEWQEIGFVEGNGTSTETNSYSYIDKNILNGKLYYRIKQIDYDGTYKIYGPVEVNIGLPLTYNLEQNYPNPFNPTTNIEYRIPNKEVVSLKVYDVLGNEVTTLVNEEKPTGRYEVKFDGSKLPSGVYIYRLTSKNYSAAKKLILLK